MTGVKDPGDPNQNSTGGEANHTTWEAWICCPPFDRGRRRRTACAPRTRRAAHCVLGGWTTLRRPRGRVGRPRRCASHGRARRPPGDVRRARDEGRRTSASAPEWRVPRGTRGHLVARGDGPLRPRYVEVSAPRTDGTASLGRRRCPTAALRAANQARLVAPDPARAVRTPRPARHPRPCRRFGPMSESTIPGAPCRSRAPGSPRPDRALVLAEWRDPGGVTDPPRYIAPLHIHHGDDEAWYVLAGAPALPPRRRDGGGAARRRRGARAARDGAHWLASARLSLGARWLVMTARIRAR